MTGIDSWSTTPATNATADGGAINWAEGQPPSTVNNTARQMLTDVRNMANDLIWFQYGTGDQGAGNIAVPAVYASGTSFTIAGANVTAAYHTGRRVRAVGSSTGTIYGSISSSSFSTNTTVNVTWDSGSLSNETLVISLSQVPVTGSPLPISASNFAAPPSGRLTLTSGTPVTTTDVTAATTVYYTPLNGGWLPIYNGSAWAMLSFSEISLALDSNSGHTGYQQSGKNFDVFVYNDSGTLRIGTGPAWTSSTARGSGAATTEISRVHGMLVNAVAITLRFGSASGNTSSVSANQGTYLGTIHMTADGQTEDSALNRVVWNMYNRRARPMLVTESADSWTYDVNFTWRQVNANSANKLQVVRGLDEDAIHVDMRGTATDPGGANFTVGLGIDSTTVNSAGLLAVTVVHSVLVPVVSSYDGYPGLGFHTLYWLEQVDTPGTTTIYGDNGFPAIGQNGMGSMVSA